MTEKYEDIQEGRENDELTVKGKQVTQILEDKTFLLIAKDEKGFIAACNCESSEDIAELLVQFATKHDLMLEALVKVSSMVLSGLAQGRQKDC